MINNGNSSGPSNNALSETPRHMEQGLPLTRLDKTQRKLIDIAVWEATNRPINEKGPHKVPSPSCTQMGRTSKTRDDILDRGMPDK